MFTDKELFRAFAYALGSDNTTKVMVGHLAAQLPCGIPINNMTLKVIEECVVRFLAK